MVNLYLDRQQTRCCEPWEPAWADPPPVDGTHTVGRTTLFGTPCLRTCMCKCGCMGMVAGLSKNSRSIGAPVALGRRRRQLVSCVDRREHLAICGVGNWRCHVFAFLSPATSAHK